MRRLFRQTQVPGVLLVALLVLGDGGRAEAGEVQLAQGAGGAPGNLNSQAIGRLPAGLPIEIVVLDDSEANLEIRDALAEALAENGFLVAPEAPLEMTFEAETLEPGVQDDRPTLGQIRAGNEAEVGNRGSERGVEAEVNVWSSTKDSLLGGRQDKDASTSHPRYHINVQLRDRESGKVVWQGDAICEMLTGDRERLVESMTGPLAAAVGRTVTGEPFEIR
jgi:hypothetical protein